MQERFWRGRGNVHTYALNWNNQYLLVGEQSCCFDQYTLYGRPLCWFAITLGTTLYIVCTRNVCQYAPYYVSVMWERFWSGIGKVHAHALNWNNQYLTLLQVCKAAALTSKHYTVLVICITSFRVVPLMYRPLRWFTIKLVPTLYYVCTLNV